MQYFEFKVFPQNSFMDLSLLQFGEAPVKTAIPSVLPPEITISFISFYPAKVPYMPIIPRAQPKHTK